MATTEVEQTQDEQCAPRIGPGGVPENATTSEYYRTKDIPARFDHPNWFEGYGGKKQHPMYRTTCAMYGGKSPTVHTLPTCFYGRSQQFSKHLGKCGMYRDHSLNTASDKSKV